MAEPRGRVTFTRNGPDDWEIRDTDWLRHIDDLNEQDARLDQAKTIGELRALLAEDPYLGAGQFEIGPSAWLAEIDDEWADADPADRQEAGVADDSPWSSFDLVQRDEEPTLLDHVLIDELVRLGLAEYEALEGERLTLRDEHQAAAAAHAESLGYEVTVYDPFQTLDE